jgi:CopG family nickel-responsive transcriptional regulator
MLKTIRFGISIPEELSKKFDSHILKKQYTNRSEAIRDLIRTELIKDEIEYDREVIGVLNLVYNHHHRELNKKLTDIQHHNNKWILSSLHFHLDHNNCLEVIVLKGKGKDLRNIAEMLIAVKGIKHGDLSLTSTGKNLE